MHSPHPAAVAAPHDMSHHAAQSPGSDQNKNKNQNLFVALQTGFAADLSATAIETADAASPMYYTWADLEQGTAMLANLLAALNLPSASRIAVHTEKSVEALMLYLAVLRAGHVYLPLNSAYQASEVEYFVGNAEPAVVVCSGHNFGWVSKIAFLAGIRHVYTLNADRSGTLLDRAAYQPTTHQPAQKAGDDLAAEFERFLRDQRDDEG